MLRLHQIFILATLYLNFRLYEGLPITNDTQREILRKLYQRLRVDVEDFGIALNFTSNESEIQQGTSSDGWSFRKVVDAIVGRKESDASEETEEAKKNGVSETINDIIHNLNEVREMVEGSNCTGRDQETGHAPEETHGNGENSHEEAEHSEEHSDEHSEEHSDEHSEEHSYEDASASGEESAESTHPTEISTHATEDAAVDITAENDDFTESTATPAAAEGSLEEGELPTTTEWPFRATFHEIGAHLGLLKIVPRPATDEEEAAITTESSVTTAIYDFVDQIKSTLGLEPKTSEENKSDSSEENNLVHSDQINSPSGVAFATEKSSESEISAADRDATTEHEGTTETNEMTTPASKTESEGHTNDHLSIASVRGRTTEEENTAGASSDDHSGENSKENVPLANDVEAKENENKEIKGVTHDIDEKHPKTSDSEDELESTNPEQSANEPSHSILSASNEESRNVEENQPVEESKNVEQTDLILGGESSVTEVPDSSTISSDAVENSFKISVSSENIDQPLETTGTSGEKEKSGEEIAEAALEKSVENIAEEALPATTTEKTEESRSDEGEINLVNQESEKQISSKETSPEEDHRVTTEPTNQSTEEVEKLETIVEETESEMDKENKKDDFSGEILTPQIIQAELERAATQKPNESYEERKSAKNEADSSEPSKKDSFSGEILTPEIILAEKERVAQEIANHGDGTSAERGGISETKSEGDSDKQKSGEIIPSAGEADIGGRDINDDLILVEAEDKIESAQQTTAVPKYATEDADDKSDDLNSRRVITHSEEMEYLEKTQTQEKSSNSNYDSSDEIGETIYGSTVIANETVPERVKDVFEELLEKQKAQERVKAADNEEQDKSAESTFGKISTWIEEKLDSSREQGKNDTDDGIFGGIISEASSVAQKAKDAIDELFKMKKSDEEEKALQKAAVSGTVKKENTGYDSWFRQITDADKSEEVTLIPTERVGHLEIEEVAVSESTKIHENESPVVTNAPDQEESDELKIVHTAQIDLEVEKREKGDSSEAINSHGERTDEHSKSEEGGGFGTWFKHVNEALQNENEARETTRLPTDKDDEFEEIIITQEVEIDAEEAEKGGNLGKEDEDAGTNKSDGSAAKEPNESSRSESANKSEGGFGTWFKHVNEALQNENQDTDEESTHPPVIHHGGEVKISAETEVTEESVAIKSTEKDEDSSGKGEIDRSESSKSEGGFGSWFKHVNEALQNENEKTEEESTDAPAILEGSGEAKIPKEAEKEVESVPDSKSSEKDVDSSGNKEIDQSESSKSEGGGFGSWFKQVNEALQNENQDKDEESTTAPTQHDLGEKISAGTDTEIESAPASKSSEKDESSGKEEIDHSENSKSEDKSEVGFGSWFKHVTQTLENETKNIIEKIDSGEKEKLAETTVAPTSEITTRNPIVEPEPVEESEERSSVLSTITASVDSAVDKVSSWFGEKLNKKDSSEAHDSESGGKKILAAEKAYERELETDEKIHENDSEEGRKEDHGSKEIGIISLEEQTKPTSAEAKSSSEEKKEAVNFAPDVIQIAEKESEDNAENTDEADENVLVKLGDDSADNKRDETSDAQNIVIVDTKSHENKNIPIYDEFSAGNAPDLAKENNDVGNNNGQENAAQESVEQAETEDEKESVAKNELAPAAAEKDASNEGGLIPQVEIEQQPANKTEGVHLSGSPETELENPDLSDYNLPEGGDKSEEDEAPAESDEIKQPVVAETENVKYEHNLSSNLISPGTDRVEPSMLSMKQFHDNKGNPEPRVNVTFNAPKDKGVYDMYIDRKGRRCSEFTELPLDVEYLREVFVNFGFSNFQLPSLGVNLNELADKAVFFKDLDDNAILCGTLTINHR